MAQTINEFRRAGIKVWMITGDKSETAEHIGYSCALFNSRTHLFRINDRDEFKLEQKLKFISKKMQELSSDQNQEYSLNLSRLDRFYQPAGQRGIPSISH